MKVKKFVAKTMPEALQDIREELGAEAVILNSKEIKKGGFLGLFKKKSIEVVAALDPQPMARRKEQPAKISITKQDISPYGPKVMNNHHETDVLKEIKYLKKILEQQTKQGESNYKLDYQMVYDYLLEQEVDRGLAKQIVDRVINSHEEIKQTKTSEQIIKDTRLEIDRKLKEVSFKGITYEQKVIHFVGPTGVGKTTTLAKIAANCMLKDNKKVAFITTDTYRIAAIEQLKTYARILDVPVAVAYTHEDYTQAIQKFSSFDIILVDTAGRNFRDDKYVKELQKNIGLNTKTYLVLSLTAKSKDITDIYSQFEHLSINEVIFTKLDETLQYGSLLNISLKHKVGIAYLTDGQDVPDDLIQPTPSKISTLILGGYFNE